ncbi:hypothetical protein D3C87_1133270 [compost metagenome]
MNAGVLDVAVVDAQVVTLADQHFRQVNQRAFAQVVGAGLEAQAQQGDFAFVVAGNDVEGVLHLGLVTAHQRVEQRRFHVQGTGAVGQGTHVFWQARAAEGEAWAHVVLGQVEGLVLADHVHHFATVDADRLGDVADFVGEGDLGGVPHVAGVLDHLGDRDVLADDRCVEFFVQRLQNVARSLVELADDGHRWQVVVGNGGGFTQEFRVDRNAEVDASLLARAVFENRDHHVGHGARQHGAAHDDGVAGSFFTQDKTDLAAYRFDVVQFEVAVLFARRTHADHRQVGVANRLGEVGRATQTTGLDTLLQKFAQAGFNNRRLAGVDHVDLVFGNIDANYVMAPCRQATGTYCANVTQTKYADAHRNYLCIYQALEAGVNGVQRLLVHSKVRHTGATVPCAGILSFECLNKCTQDVRNQALLL